MTAVLQGDRSSQHIPYAPPGVWLSLSSRETDKAALTISSDGILPEGLSIDLLASVRELVFGGISPQQVDAYALWCDPVICGRTLTTRSRLSGQPRPELRSRKSPCTRTGRGGTF